MVAGLRTPRASSCNRFDDAPCGSARGGGKGGGCGLLTVELDRRAGDDAPRVTVKRFQPLEGLAKADAAAVDVRAPTMQRRRACRTGIVGVASGSGIVRLVVPIAGGREALIVAGRDYSLDAEVAARIERITGEGSVELVRSGTAEAGAGRLNAVRRRRRRFSCGSGLGRRFVDGRHGLVRHRLARRRRSFDSPHSRSAGAAWRSHIPRPGSGRGLAVTVGGALFTGAVVPL